jgi:hypothetical protein
MYHTNMEYRILFSSLFLRIWAFTSQQQKLKKKVFFMKIMVFFSWDVCFFFRRYVVCDSSLSAQAHTLTKKIISEIVICVLFLEKKRIQLKGHDYCKKKISVRKFCDGQTWRAINVKGANVMIPIFGNFNDNLLEKWHRE